MSNHDDCFTALHDAIPYGGTIGRAVVLMNQRKHKEGAWMFQIEAIEQKEPWWSDKVAAALYSFAAFLREEEPRMKVGHGQKFSDGNLLIWVTKITTCVWLVDVLHNDEDEDESDDDEKAEADDPK